jgi:hypothetical protein
MTARPGMQYNPASRYKWRGSKAKLARLAVVTVRCLFCCARYSACIGPRIACPVCGRVEAER